MLSTDTNARSSTVNVPIRDVSIWEEHTVAKIHLGTSFLKVHGYRQSLQTLTERSRVGGTAALSRTDLHVRNLPLIVGSYLQRHPAQKLAPTEGATRSSSATGMYVYHSSQQG